MEDSAHPDEIRELKSHFFPLVQGKLTLTGAPQSEPHELLTELEGSMLLFLLPYHKLMHAGNPSRPLRLQWCIEPWEGVQGESQQEVLRAWGHRTVPLGRF